MVKHRVYLRGRRPISGVQRTASGAAALVAFTLLLGFWHSLVKRFAIRKLQCRTGFEEPPVAATSQRKLELRVGRLFYLRHGKESRLSLGVIGVVQLRSSKRLFNELAADDKLQVAGHALTKGAGAR